MKLVARIVTVALATASLGAVGVGTASAATAGTGHDASAPSSTSTSTVTVVAFAQPLSALSSVTIPRFACPSEQPWLRDVALSSSNRNVPRGVQVVEPGSISVTIPAAAAGPKGLASGWTTGSATNWGSYNGLTITAVCTEAPDGGYPA